MLYDCDEGVLLVRRRAVMTQMQPYTLTLTSKSAEKAADAI